MSHASSGDSEEEEEEEEEPILKYGRVEGAISSILERDSVSAFAICEKLIALGSHDGLIYLLNLDGTEIKRYRAHSASVSAVSIDQSGCSIASSGIDGRVVVYDTVKSESFMYDFKRPVKSVSIDPEYSRNGKGRLISGGLSGQLVVSEKGWFGNKETVIGSNEGPIISTVWNGNLVAWSNDQGVRVYDILNMRTVGLVERRPDNPRADVFKCRLLWQDAQTLIVGWFDHISKVVIQEGVGKVLNLDITYVMKLDSVVSGLATSGPNILVIAYIADLEDLTSLSPSKRAAERPEIRIINPQFEEISEDALGLRGYARLQPNDYAIFAHPMKQSFFIVSPKDIISARERDLADHVQWLIDTAKYEEALEATRDANGLPLHLSYGEVGRQFIDYLQGQEEYARAAAVAAQVLKEDAEAWEKLIFAFAEKGHLEEITPFVPTEKPTLSSLVYEMALGRYLSSNHSMLLQTIRRWPADLYNAQDIANAVEHKLIRSKDDLILKECLAELLLKTDQPREALPYYLALGKSETFDLIEQFHLFDAVQDNVLELVLLDAPKNSTAPAHEAANHAAINLLVQHSHSVPIAKVVAQLGDHPALLYCYFRALLEHDPHLAADYGDLQIKLYAEYDREKLMELLKTTTSYSLEQASKICEQRDYIPELVYILGKTGNNKKALKLILEKLGDVKQAISYAYSQADSELWEDLISYSLDKPSFIRGLLENAGTAIKPITLIRRLRPGLVIEGLKDSLTKIFNDFDLQLSLSQCGSNIHRREVTQLSNRLRAGQKRGMSIASTSMLDKESDIFVVFDGQVIDKVALGSEAISRQSTGHKRGEQRRGRRQTTALKVTDCAINHTKLSSYLTTR